MMRTMTPASRSYAMDRTMSDFRNRGFTVNPVLLQMSVGDIFDKLDTRGLGALTKEDLRAGFLLSEAQLDEETLTTLWLIADENEDESVDVYEFEKIWSILIRQGLHRVKEQIADLRRSGEGPQMLESPAGRLNDSFEDSFGSIGSSSPVSTLVITKSTVRNYKKQLCRAGLNVKPELLRCSSVAEVFECLTTRLPLSALSKSELKNGFHVQGQPLTGDNLDMLWAIANDNLEGRVSKESFEAVWMLVVHDFVAMRETEQLERKKAERAAARRKMRAQAEANRAARAANLERGS